MSAGVENIEYFDKIKFYIQRNFMQRTVLGGSSSASSRKGFITLWSVQKFDWNCTSYKSTPGETQTKAFRVFLAMEFVTPVQIYHKIYQIYMQWEQGDG